MMIPKKYNLFGSTVKILFDNKRMDDVKAYGYYEHSKLTITLSDFDGVNKLSEDRMAESFYHEKVHSILEAMHEHDLSNNEKFVHIFSKLLLQSDRTSEF